MDVERRNSNTSNQFRIREGRIKISLNKRDDIWENDHRNEAFHYKYLDSSGSLFPSFNVY